MLKRIFHYAFSSQSKQPTKKMYVLSQFPYPSGDLHLGHARVYFIGDSISTYYRLKNYKVIYPIGWDSFGLPAENAAIIHRQNPKKWTESNIERMKEQLRHLKIGFNWQMELSTCSPEYYRWTQEIFVKMFRKGLAYKKLAQVNWDPVDKTVLANEQVDQNGCSWRSGAKVQKKMLSQWFFKITEYAEELQHNLDNLQWIQKVKNMQRGWINYKKGYKILFSLIKNTSSQIQVFIHIPQSLQTSKFIIKKALQNQTDHIYDYAKNPYNHELIPVIHSSLQQSQSYILVDQNNIKSHDIYREIMVKLGVKIGETKNGGDGKEDFIREIVESGQKVSQMRLKDWLISRQRFWGCPIPIIYCKNCGILPVPQDQLPVILPEWNNSGNPLLKDEFKKCTCPQCGHPEAQRQSDTMDTFVDSSWYFLRFMDNQNAKQIFSNANVSSMMPVDIYIGGIEHAIMHLLYARFIMRFIQREYNLPKNCAEPFKQLVVQGLVKGKTLALKENGKYVSQKDVDSGKYSIDEVKITYEKMSKSKFNGLNPNLLVDKFGSDALRVAIFFANPPDRDIDFSEEIVLNAQKFLQRIENVWKELSLLSSLEKPQANNLLPKQQLLKLKNIFEKMEISIQKRLMHTYVANVMEMFNLIKDFIQLRSEKIENANKVKLFAVFVRVLKIVAPELSGELRIKIVGKFGTFVKDQEFDRWPSDELFGEKIEVLVMKGKKMISKDVLDVGLSDEQIAKALGIEGKVQEIKRQKKKFVVILKE